VDHWGQTPIYDVIEAYGYYSKEKRMDSKTALINWKEEEGSAYLYHFVAESEKGTPRAELFKH
jgi:hypothetical protein